MEPNTKVVATTTKFQPNATNNTENAQLAVLVFVAGLGIAAVVYVAKMSTDLDHVAPAAITAISGMVLAAIGAITVAIRKRRTRTGRS
ncbi:hypothetical protein [Micromonospora chalcea]|uniref:hypothetical protein n=1 Tax=Micromonospora chalcea TaxID=1874 RepID=UPI00157D2E5A|nr:hypothetical protein [Micromonospora chalcea]